MLAPKPHSHACFVAHPAPSHVRLDLGSLHWFSALHRIVFGWLLSLQCGAGAVEREGNRQESRSKRDFRPASLKRSHSFVGLAAHISTAPIWLRRWKSGYSQRERAIPQP